MGVRRYVHYKSHYGKNIPRPWWLSKMYLLKKKRAFNLPQVLWHSQHGPFAHFLGLDGSKSLSLQVFWRESGLLLSHAEKEIGHLSALQIFTKVAAPAVRPAVSSPVPLPSSHKQTQKNLRTYAREKKQRWMSHHFMPKWGDDYLYLSISFGRLGFFEVTPFYGAFFALSKACFGAIYHF